ncbi:hypothetical protein AB205_0043660 [Aquarana catesbeiana]|uniref:Uncharacterized protein n=1 Tax=Aquarana catesbeiana TaxID=8400 RepID=A0A2G9RW71_AQUCT|nr:hypothetical protein AB205_0043660 [Aquarana catesbeiana]
MTKICVCVCFADGTDANEILGPDADDIGCTEVHDEECDSDVENEQNHDPNVEEFLQQSDTAVIYPEAPEDDQRQGTPEASGHDENDRKRTRRRTGLLCNSHQSHSGDV